jgi:hypothetical protein
MIVLWESTGFLIHHYAHLSSTCLTSHYVDISSTSLTALICLIPVSLHSSLLNLSLGTHLSSTCLDTLISHLPFSLSSFLFYLSHGTLFFFTCLDDLISLLPVLQRSAMLNMSYNSCWRHQLSLRLTLFNSYPPPPRFIPRVFNNQVENLVLQSL